MVYLDIAFENQGLIGGTFVEIDESKIGKRKYNSYSIKNK
jgi:hypothetical protein